MLAAVGKRLAFAFLFMALPIATAWSEPAPYDVYGVLSLTGPIAYLGNDHKQALDTVAAYVNEHGGIHGRPLRFVIKDDQSSPVVAVQLVNGLIQQHVPVIVGPNVTATCAAAVPLVKDGPVLYCLSPAIHPTRGSYIFSSSVRIVDDAVALLHYAHDRGWSRIAMITATDASGQEVDRAFAQAFAMPENSGVHLIDREHFNTTDLSVDAQMSHMKTLKPNAVIAWTTGTSFGTLLHGIRDVGISVPIIAGSGNMIKAQLAQYGGLLPDELYFAGLRGMTRDPDAPPRVRQAQAVYWAALKKSGVEPSYTTCSTWDYLMVLVDALKHAGPNPTPAAIRDYIDNLRDWAGIQGIYDFRDAEQRGIGEEAVVIQRWERRRGEFTAVSGPGGHVR